MDSAIISDESSDVDLKTMKDQLIEFGLEEDNLSKEEMIDLLKALNNSKSTIKEDEVTRQKITDALSPLSPEITTLKRRYVNVIDRRMPWSLISTNLTNVEKARLLSVYIKLMSINKHRQARQRSNFATWPLPIQIVEETSNKLNSLRSTRSGRCVKVYCSDIDDDSSDTDFVVSKPKKRKVSITEDNNGEYSNKVISLKRKPVKDDFITNVKERKISHNHTEASTSTLASDCQITSSDLFTIIED